MSSATRRLFGTDGIRGVAGEFPLSQESTFLIGRALGDSLLRHKPAARVVIGQDTRASSFWIADRVALGLRQAGAEVKSAGVITTPGVAYLARSHGFDAGVVISASHNPWTDNGIKVFSGDGFKLPDARELEIEQEIFSLLGSGQASPQADLGSTPTLPGEHTLRRDYIEWLAKSIHTDLSRLKVLVDCANGAATAEAPGLFRACQVTASFIHSTPDGKNINENCGALHAGVVAEKMAAAGGAFDLGITFDGDADRALFSDARGRVINGDAVLLVAAREMQAGGTLRGSIVVATSMSNMGLEVALKESGIRMLRANVGDKYVLEEMMKTGATLGGEQSGHIIFRDGEATTGDGLLTALRLMEIMARRGRSLADLVSDLKIFPQRIENVRVREKVPFDKVPEVREAIEHAQSTLDGRGRVVVRYSGTEPLARVMVEADSEEKMNAATEAISGSIRRALGL
jgi:phosphoglucosamine mutase